MKKSRVLLKSGSGQQFDKLNEGDLVFTFQANRTNNDKNEYQLMTSMDWSFDDETTTQEIHSFLGSILSSIEDVFGEKMVTEAITHYAQERDHLIMTSNGAALSFRSKGLDFKNWRK